MQFLFCHFKNQQSKGWAMQDFDRGSVQMGCDQREKGCAYMLPHYHCKICGYQVNSDELRRDYHPCCSLGCILAYNQ